MKKRKRFVSVVCLLLALLMVFSLLFSIIPVQAYAVSWDDISEITQQKSELANRVAECRNRIDLLKQEQATVLEAKSAFEEQNRAANEQLNLVAQEIAIYDDMIAEKEKELTKAIRKEEKQLDAYRTRVRAMEENGSYNILALIVNSRSFSEFLTAMDDMGEIMESDKKLERQYIEAREETEEVKAEFEAVRTEMEGKQAALKEEQAEIEASIEQAYKDMLELEAAIEKAIEEYKAAEAAEAAAAATIASMIAAYNEQIRQQQLAQQQQQLAQQQQQQQQQQQTGNGGDNSGSVSSGDNSSGGSNEGSTDNSGSNTDNSSNTNTNTGSTGGAGTGSFIWPVPSSTLITSRFGYRSDPFLGTQKWHSGIDIDGFNKEGYDVVAADGGTVITASSDGGYGNYVIIDHGNYTQTLYAHLSYIAVSRGSYVSQGQVIGGLGSTGRSTGTHCHYEIFVNGERTDPAAYYSGLSYWNC